MQVATPATVPTALVGARGGAYGRVVSGERDRVVDLVRAASMLGVVLGHWLVADVAWTQAEVHESSVLVEAPELWPLTWLVLVIPLFFFVGGFSNARSWRGAQGRSEGYASFVHRRLYRLLAPVALFLAVVVPVGMLVQALGGLGVSLAAVIVLQPLWFLGVYVLAVAMTPLTLRWHERWGIAVPVVLVALSVAIDVAEFGIGWRGVGYLNAVVVWVLVHQLGYFYADGRWDRRTAGALAVTGWASAIVLAQSDLLPYSSFMVGVPGVAQGNMHPPTLVVVALALGAIGAVMLARPALGRLMRRPAVWRGVIAANLSIMTIYLWHETALVVAARLVLPLADPDQPTGSALWWLGHLTWLIAPALVLLVIVIVAGPAERRSATGSVTPTAVATASTVAAIVLLSMGLLALAGSPVTQPFAVAARLGPLRASVVMGVLLTVSAALLIRALPRGDSDLRRTMLLVALALAAAAGLHMWGAGPFPADAVAAAMLLACAALPALGCLVPARSPGSLLSHP